jgi:ABC-type bacteriocin/lantibiotic exporter with double-glycine peptidase domain
MFWVLLFVGLLDGAVGFAIPLILSEFTRSYNQMVSLTKIALPLIILCTFATLGLQWCLRRWGEALSGWLSNDIKADLFAQIAELRAEALSRLHSGYLASLVNQVANSIGGIATTVIWLVGHCIITLLLFFIFTARESILLACINTVTLALFGIISVILSRRIVPFADTVNTTAAMVAERFFDLLSNITTVKRLGISAWGQRALRQTATSNNHAIAAFQRFHANRWLLLHAIFFATFLTTLVLLLFKIEANLLAPSILILFVAGFSTVKEYAERLSELVKTLLETNAYVSRLIDVLGSAEQSGRCPVSQFRALSCQDLLFRYPNSQQSISIPEFSVTVGDRILVTGSSGQGESTLISLISKQLCPQSGELYWNEESYASFDETLQCSFAFVSQETELFTLTLRENLLLGREVPDEEIIEILKQLDLNGFVDSLPDGLNTAVGERGLTLSTGQKQRINLARGLLLQRPILLLDEPTSNLDPATEAIVLKFLAQLSPELTLIIVSHSEALRSLCSRHYKFIDGVLHNAV